MSQSELKDKIILVTGSTDGIGKQTALDLLGLGAHVIIHGRNPLRTNAVFEHMKNIAGPDNLSVVSGDLASFNEIRIMSEELHKRFDRIDVLVNNAGVYCNQRELSQDGLELTLAVNHLAGFYLTGLLLDLLKTAPGSRIINVASQAHASQLDFDNLQGEIFYDAYDAYSRSKLCNILFTNRLAQLLSSSTITTNSLHPGVISTKLLHAGWGSGGSHLKEGSQTSVYLATSPDVEHVSGKYFSNRRIANPASISDELAIQKRLWEASEQMTGFRFTG